MDKKHLNPSPNHKNRHCPIINIMLNRYIGNPPPNGMSLLYRFKKEILLQLVDIRYSQFSILNSQFSILNSQFSSLKSQFSSLNSQFSILNSQFSGAL